MDEKQVVFTIGFGALGFIAAGVVGAIVGVIVGYALGRSR